MKFTDKRTKIITTIGPASESSEKMHALFKAGMTTIRLNFSHGDHEEQLKRVVTARKISQEIGFPISIMLDTKGPEIRVGKMVDDRQQFEAGQAVKIYTTAKEYTSRVCKSGELTLSYDASKDIKKGKPVLVDDGKLEINVTDVKPGIISGTARNAHMVKTNKRVNLPGTRYSMPFLAEKDIKDVILACKEKMDYIAASFVNSADDIKEIRALLKKNKGEQIKIISKIESQHGVDYFDEILAASDGIMVARGDLGLEIPYYEVPVAQKMMIRKCRAVGKPVIVATQMLDSMENNPHPTRAEVSDVYFAVELGADSTMLSGESAAGKYPVESVEVMATINQRAEGEFYNKTYYTQYLANLPVGKPGSRENKAYQVAQQAKDGDFKYAVVLSRTGHLLSTVASYRPNVSVLGVSPDPLQYTMHGITSSIFMYYDTKGFDEIKKDKSKAAKVVKHFGGVKGDKYFVVENDKITTFTL